MEIGEGVAPLCEDAFYGCSALTCVDIPASLRAIGRYAFGMCTALEEAIIPGGLEQINDLAFGSAGLKTAKLPESYAHTWARQNGLSIKVMEAEGDEAPSDAALFLAAAREDGPLEITGLSADGGCPTELVIPAQIDGVEVTAISGYPGWRQCDRSRYFSASFIASYSSSLIWNPLFFITHSIISHFIIYV